MVHMTVLNSKAQFPQVYSDKKEQDVHTEPSDYFQSERFYTVENGIVFHSLSIMLKPAPWHLHVPLITKAHTHKNTSHTDTIISHLSPWPLKSADSLLTIFKRSWIYSLHIDTESSSTAGTIERRKVGRQESDFRYSNINHWALTAPSLPLFLFR